METNTIEGFLNSLLVVAEKATESKLEKLAFMELVLLKVEKNKNIDPVFAACVRDAYQRIGQERTSEIMKIARG